MVRSEAGGLVSARDQLATSCGVATEYWDLGGALRVVPDSTVESTLAALGVHAESEADYEAALAQRRKDHWERTLPPLWVVREQDTNGPWVHHPDGKPPLIWVELEEGGRRYDLPLNEEVRVLLPTETATTLHYTCGMDMVRGRWLDATTIRERLALLAATQQ